MAKTAKKKNPFDIFQLFLLTRERLDKYEAVKNTLYNVEKPLDALRGKRHKGAVKVTNV